MAAAERVGYPVVLKSTAPMLRHQGGVGGVRVDLRTEESLRDAWESLTERLAPLDADRLVVQKMATPGVPCVITSDEDPLFGPVIGFSVAGMPTELLDDIAYRIPPLTDVDRDRAHLVGQGRAGAARPPRRHAGAPGGPGRPHRPGVGARRRPRRGGLAELNPVNAHPGGVEVLGAEIVLAPAPRAGPTRGAAP